MNFDWLELQCLLWLYIVQAAYIEEQWRTIEANSRLIADNDRKLRKLRVEASGVLYRE